MRIKDWAKSAQRLDRLAEFLNSNKGKHAEWHASGGIVAEKLFLSYDRSTRCAGFYIVPSRGFDMDEAVKALTVTRVNYEDGQTILLELSDHRTVSLTVEDVLLLDERRSTRLQNQG